MYWPEFLAIAIAHLFAVASPGPDFAVVTGQCVTGGARAGLWTSLGVGTGKLVHVAYCMLGVAVLLAQSPVLFTIMKCVAATYLLVLGVQSFRALSRTIASKRAMVLDIAFKPGKAFALGFLTSGLSPKTTLFFLALFTTVIDANTPALVQGFYGIYLAITTFIWFALLSMVLGRRRVRDFMLRTGVWFRRGMGTVLILLAARIAFGG